MQISEKVEQQWKEAMKGRLPTKDALSLIRTELKNRAIAIRQGGDHSTAIDDETAIAVLTRMTKQRRESIEEYERGGREDLVAKEKLELSTIESFLPKQMSVEEIVAAIKEAQLEVGEAAANNLGALMKILTPRLKGKADGRVILTKVKEILVG